MHFNVLAAVALPKEVTALPGESEIVRASLQKIHVMLEKAPDNGILQLARELHENHLIPLEQAAYNLVSDVLEPFGMYTENPAYLAFLPCEDSDDRGYETAAIDCVRFPNRELLPANDWRFCERYEIFEGKVYQKNSGPLHHRKRTKNAKKILSLPACSMKKLYPTVGEYMRRYRGLVYSEEDQAYGYYSNPNAFWDWFKVGGRWPHSFLVKEDCPYVVRGDQRVIHVRTKATPEGYQWVAGARKCDIAWEEMKQVVINDVTAVFQQLRSWFLFKEIPEERRDSVTVTEEGVFIYQQLAYRSGETLEDHLRQAGYQMENRYFVNTYAFIDTDGWKDCDDFDTDCQGGTSDMRWNRMIQDFVAGLPEEALLVSVDCHS